VFAPLFFIACAIPGQPVALRAQAPTTPESLEAFVGRVLLSTRGAVTLRTISDPVLPARVEWDFAGVARIEGVACERRAFATDANIWGCQLARMTATTFNLPTRTVASFSRADGSLVQLVLPKSSSLQLGELRCTGVIDLDHGTVTRCELAGAHRLRGVELPAAAVLQFTIHGRLLSATITGRTATAAGRTWGPEYTTCGVLDLRFGVDGRLVVPQADPLREMCCD
jgi:hypothetical protein